MTRTSRKLTYFASMIALAAVVTLSGCGKKEEATVEMKQVPPQQTPVASAEQGQTAPNFALASYEGDSKTLADYEGKVVMLNFWATWCGPCKREIPDFIDLQKTYEGKGLEIVGVALDDPNDVRNFVDNSQINYDILFGSDQIAMAYGNIRSIPTTFLIGRDGKIVSSFVGMRPKEQWVEQIQSLL